MGTEIIGKTVGVSKSIEYSTPLSLITPLIKEFNIKTDVCASKLNHKLEHYFTKEDNALLLKWNGNCWMNPPFDKNLGVWVRKAHYESKTTNGTKVCLFPVRSNTKWWNDVCDDAEIRFINGEVNFNDEPRGLWWPMCIMIFGEKAKVKTFSTINYRMTRAALKEIE
jgi:site-specific DNA-methyltransferase (adenine-specific)